MRFTETKKDTRKDSRWEFNSFGEALEYAEKRICPMPNQTLASRRPEDSYTKWFRSADIQEACKMGVEGWPEGYEQVKLLADALYNKVTQLVDRETIRFDVTGNDFDIALVNQGVPEAWYTIEKTEVQTGTGTKILRLTFNCVASAGISQAVLIARGAVACALVEVLEYSGFRVAVELYWVVRSNEFGTVYTIHAPIKAADEHLDRDRLAFALAHPSTQRRICFGIAESNKAFMLNDAGCGYGKCAEVETSEQGDVHFTQGMLGEPQWTDAKSATNWILRQMQKQGVILSEEVPA